MDIYEEVLKFHKDHKWKIAIVSRAEVTNFKNLSLAYPLGVSQPYPEIFKKSWTRIYLCKKVKYYIFNKK